MVVKNKIRKFKSGATRDQDKEKIQYARHLSPLMIKEFGKYMHKHRFQSDGKIREPDNWKKGMPLQSYLDSMFRHMLDFWLIHETGKSIRPETGEVVSIKDALCGIMFNAQGYLHEISK